MVLTAASVRVAIRKIKSQPDRLLTHAEELILARGYRAGIEAETCRDLLIWRNLGLAHNAAATYARDEHRDDAVAAALEGLCRAVETFDPDRGLRFSTYALHWARQRARRYAASYQETIRVAEHMVYKAHRIRKAWAHLCLELERNPTPEELEDRTGLDRATIGIARRTMALAPRSLDDPLDQSVLAAVTGGADEPFNDEHRYDELYDAILSIDLDTRSMLVRHYGLDGRKPETLQAIAMTYGYSRQAIHSRLDSALQKIREKM